MIVNTMTLQEIHNELYRDVPSLNPKLNHCRKEFRRKVLKASTFPCTIKYEINTAIKKNLFIVGLTALSKRNAEKPLLSVYGIYDRPEGSYVASLSIDFRTTSIYPPHFFKRYRERIVKDERLSNKQLIKLYFDKCNGFYQVIANKKHAAVYNIHESTDSGGIGFVGATDEGFCFGEKLDNINVIKTIISDDMLFEDQIELFHVMRKEYNEANKARYGANFKPLQL